MASCCVDLNDVALTADYTNFVDHVNDDVAVNIYSWGHLVVPYTEELISRPFLDDNSI